MGILTDSSGRKFHYLRLSVTDRCNFRCVYCLPTGYQATEEAKDPELSVEETRRICAGFAELGFSKVRVTGGEPTVRRDILEIVRAIASVPGIRKVALTTNGHNLERIATSLREAGLNSLNVSLDSLDADRFQQLTGSGRFENVIRGIDQALCCGFDSVKLNAVMMKGFIEQDVPAFLEWVRARRVSVRFIELMRTGKNVSLFAERHWGAGDLQLYLLRSGWKSEPQASDSGPAVEFSHPDYLGKIGLIAPYSEDFCASCNRLRVSARGKLRLCLFGEEDFSLRPLIKGPDYAERLAAEVRALIHRKPPSHYLQEGKYGNTWNLASIGG